MKYVGLLLLFCLAIGPSWAQNDPDTNLIWPLNPTYDPTQTNEQSFDLGDPNSVERTIVYDPVTGKYIFKEVIGGSELNYRNPSMMTLEEYIEYERQKALADNWKEKIDEQTAENQPFEFPIKVGNKVFENFFGSDQITIRTTGSVEISLGVNSSRYDNPILPVRQRRITRFDFQQQINLNLVGQIGTRVKLGTSYNTQAAFDFDNISTLEYTGDDDQIIQKIQLGNVSFQPPTSLIQGSQVLFGAYSQLKFGNTTVDLIGASSRGQKKEINIAGGSQTQQFEVTADNYEVNRHYFLNMYHHDNYDKGMSTLPIPNTTINLTRIEVWVMNRTNETENTRNIIAFSDLGEAKQENCQGDPGGYSSSDLPSNDANDLYNWASNQPLVRGFNNSVQALAGQFTAPGPFQQAVHFEKVENARKLNDSEYSYNAQLGFVSLNMPLNNDEVLAVSYEYTYQGDTYQVGEFSTDGIAGQDALLVKLLKPTITNPRNAIWPLMMKNVYSIGAYQVDQQGFRLNILYNNPLTSVDVPFLPISDLTGGQAQSNLDDDQIVTVLEMDKLNQNNQPFSDGVFDFVPINFNGNRAESAGTINRRNGRIYFSTVEPFGKTLADKLAADGLPQVTIDQVAYTELYDSTKTAAQQIPAKNRFSFKGEYQSSITSDIPLNALNVPEGAVTVTAGGILLTEGQDYTVDYNLGRVKILNESYLNSNTPIKISIESNSVFGFQSKSLLGSRVAHRFSDKFNVGATWMRMMERPVTQKVDIGSEPYKNNIIGFDLAYRTDVPLLTKLVDLLPVISTKERSTFSFTGEFAHLIPGSPRAINRNGTSYIDDFEGAQSTIDLRSATAWHLASVPKGQPDLFPEASNLDLSAGYKRARTSWYVVDPLFAQGSNLTPQHIKDNPELISDSRVRLIGQQELFPNVDLQIGQIGNIPVLDLAYYPKERGMYNFDITETVDQDGKFVDPENRWGGIMRALTTNDFELTNIEYIQFWMLDPFNDDAEAVDPNSNHSGGDMYFNLGNISEDVLPDSRRSFENGLPPFDDSSQDNLDETTWARISTLQQTVNAFDNDPLARVNQDVGYDGWNNEEEALFYSSYVNWVQNSTTLNAAAKARMLADPSNDDYRFYRDDVYDQLEANILERYKSFRGVEGNSPTIEMSDTMNVEGYPTQATNQPDMEEFNNNNTLDETESYFQYRVSLRPNDLVEGQNYITNIQNVPKGNTTERWIQFKVPIRDFEKRVNGIQDFRTIRFMRIFLKDFNEEVVVRFARLEFIRGEWRQYLESLVEPGEGVTTDPNLTTFNIGAVNIQENEQRDPIKYEIPPGIVREVDPSQTFQRQLNEQSLTLEVCNLQDGDARAGYRNVQFDVRTYKKLKMFAHAERVEGQSTLNDDDLTLFVRLGTDFEDNYYEYEMPLKLTDFNGPETPESIWPEENNVEIVFDDFLKLKKERNELSAPTTTEYVTIDPANAQRVLKVKGSPNLQGLKTIMIGIRNPHINKDTPWSDDGLAKCVNAWINELRLTDFVSEGGSAATAQMQVQFADFANLNMSGSYSGINWGSVDSRVQERQRNQKLNFDMNASVQLGQFFGKKARVQLPFFYSYSVGVVNPEFDPFNPDIRLADYDNAEVRRERAKLGQDFTERRAYNFTNVRKELKAGADNHFWRISNWTYSYAYSQNLRRDFNTKVDRTQQWTSSLNYNYSFKSKPIMPFKKVKFMQRKKWWALIRDMNFYLTPKNISFGTDAMRNYNERQIRNNTIPDGIPEDELYKFELDPVYLKQFNWNRQYSMDYDITKKLKFQFSANNRSMFEEGDGAVEQNSFRDTLNSQLGTFGRGMDYSHNFSFRYTLPFNQIPATDWISANATWKGSYNWQRGPLAQPEYGNTIQNSRDINMTAQLNFTSLYNKVKFFKKVNNGGRNPRGRASARDKDGDKRGGAKKKPEAEEEEDPNLTERQKERKRRKEERKKEREEREKARGGKVHPVAGFLARILMTVRNVNGTYSITDGTFLPGYNQRSGILGFDPGNNAGIGGFVFGQQRFNAFGRETGYNIADRLASNDPNATFIVQNPNLNQQYTFTHNENINLRATLEPIKDMSIELTANRVYSRSSSEFYRWNPELVETSPGVFDEGFESQSRVEISTLTYSNVSISSAFALIGKEYESSVFQNLLDNRAAVSELLGSQNGNSSLLTSGFYDGYSRTQQEVVLGAFLTSYTNRSVSEKNINPVRNMPLPNWSINYNGLKNFKFMKKALKNFVMRHGYTSSVSVTGMQTNLNAAFDANGGATARDLNNNFIAQDQIQNVTVTERFSPLIGFDATWNIKDQGLITKFEFKKDRSSSLSLNNNQVTEILGSEWVIGTGYKFSKVKLPFEKIPASPVNVRVDISFRDNLTVIRNIDENSNQATAGQRVIAIKSSADYNLSKYLVIQFYYDQTLNTPKVATSYPTGNMSTGLRLRFNLAGVQ